MTVVQARNADDPRVKRTRQMLQQALESLLLEKPFDDISVQDITERATVNRATFYAHYQDKFDIADSITREVFKRHLTNSVQITSPIAEDTLRKLSLAVFDFLITTHGHCKLDRQLETLLEGAMYNVLSEFTIDWLGQGIPERRREVDLMVTAQTISSAFIGAGLRWIRGDRKHPVAELAKQIVAVLAPGVLSSVSVNN